MITTIRKPFRYIAQEALMQREMFTKRFLMYKPSHLVLPNIPLQNTFVMPRNALWHYVSLDGIIKGPSDNDWQLNAVEKKIAIQYVTKLEPVLGAPKPATLNVQSENDAYLRSNKRFRRSRDLVNDDPGESAAVVLNYSYLPRLYRYTRTLFTEYFKWYNIYNTVIAKINEMETDRDHLVFIGLPQKFPSIGQIKQLMLRQQIEVIRQLKDHDGWMIFELMKWINPETRDKSLFGQIKTEKLDKVIILIEDAGRLLSFRLGTLDSWILHPDNPDTTNRIPAIEAQKRFMRGCFSLMQQRADAQGTFVDEDDEDADSVRNALAEDQQKAEHSENVIVVGNDQQVDDDDSFASRVDKILAELDEEMEEYDKSVERSLIQEENDGVLETIVQRVQSTQEVKAEKVEVFDYLQDKLDYNADRGSMTAVEYRRFNKHLANAADLPNPYGGDTPAHVFGKVDPEETVITDVLDAPDSNTLVDKSMRKRVFENLNGDYIEKTLKRDIVGCVQAIQKAGVIVSSHSVSQQESVSGAFEMHEIKLVPIEGAPSTLRIKNVVVEKDGRIHLGGNQHRYRWQRVDLPILKISPSKVALSSYYGKNFVMRCDRVAYNYNKWLQKQIGLKIVEGGTFSSIHSGSVFNHEVSVPRAFSAVAQNWRDMKMGDIDMDFNIDHQERLFKDVALDYVRSLNMTPFGKDKGKGILYAMDVNSAVYSIKDGNVQALGSFEEFIGINPESKPLEFTECRILGKNIPTGIVLGYYYGLSKLIKMLGAKVLEVPAGTRANLGPNDWSLVFEDYTLVFSQDDKLATMVLSGFNQASKVLRRYNSIHFDEPAVYYNLLESMGMSSRYIRELENLRDLFVDPITERVLKKMGEPLTYPELVVRSSEMLLDEKHKRPLDPTGQRYRGAERVAGAMYTQLVQSIREQRSKASRNSAKIEMNPYAVWRHVTSDPSLTIVRDINPIHNLKEITAMTYTGHGGRSGRSMTRSSRGMDPNDLGSLSEATVDSADVGFNAYLSMAPRIGNTEGMLLDPAGKDSPHASMLSAAALASPGLNCDDAKRIAMCSIQHTHTVACEGYVNNPIRTGFEKMVAHQVDSSFASTAKTSGVIKKVDKHSIVVAYDDGTEQSYAIGRRFGLAAGAVLPHDMVTDFQEGDKFEAGAVLVYCKGFFRPDPFKKGEVNWVNGTLANVAFMESVKTHEDASSVSVEFSKKLSMQNTTVKNVIVNFNQVVHNLVEEGQSVKYDDALCFIEDEGSARAKLFDSESINTLKSLERDAPMAGVSGVVDRVEIYYHGHTDDMSESISELVRKSDLRLARRRKAEGKSVVTGQEDEGFNIEGNPLMLDTICIRVYITRHVGAGVGDKIVFGHQLKSEISEVFTNTITTEDGKPIDAFYGAKSLFGRNVYSPFQIGTTVPLLRIISKKMASIYKGKQ